LQNLTPNLDQNVGRATYTQVMTRQAGSHFSSAPLAANGAVAWNSCIDAHTVNCFMTTLAVAPAMDRWRLFFVLVSAVVGQSLCGEGEPFALTTVS